MVNYNKSQTVIVMYCIKIRLLQFLQMLLFLLMNINVHLHPNSSYYYYCHLKLLIVANLAILDLTPLRLFFQRFRDKYSNFLKKPYLNVYLIYIHLYIDQ